MESSSSSRRRVEQSIMARWLRANVTGCVFASRYGRGWQKGAAGLRFRIVTEAVDARPTLARELAWGLDDAALHGEALAILFPRLRRPESVALLIRSLARHERWTWTLESWRKHSREELLVRLEFLTTSGHRSSVLGLGPFGTMPVLRRSPYVGLVIWAGEHENPFWKTASRTVGLVDMPHGLDEATYESWWAQSQDNKRRFLADQDEGAAHHTVSFCLPRSPRVVELLESNPVTD